MLKEKKPDNKCMKNINHNKFNYLKPFQKLKYLMYKQNTVCVQLCKLLLKFCLTSCVSDLLFCFDSHNFAFASTDFLLLVLAPTF